MRLVRSWPAHVPPHRAHVVDDIDHLIMDRFDYRILADVDDDLLLFEWDIAIGAVGLDLFIARALDQPGRVQVAPYQIHQSLRGNVYPCHPMWAHRRYEGTPETGRTRFITPDDETCHLFGFGAIYLPRPDVRKFLEWYPEGHFDDCAFAGWHYVYSPDPEVPVYWDVPIVHLHYPLPQPREG